MADITKRAAGIAAWTYDNGQTPTYVIDNGRSSYLRGSEWDSGKGKLVTMDELQDTQIEADVTSYISIDVGTNDALLYMEKANPHRVQNTQTRDTFEVSVSGHEVTVRGNDGVDKLEVY